MTTSSRSPLPPSDLELMQYLDGELDERRHAEVAAAVDRDDEARAKLFCLALVARQLRDAVDSDTRADGIADAVMARIRQPEDGAARGGAKVIPLRRPEPRPGSEAEPAEQSPPASRRRGGARSIFLLAAAAAAVAAGLFLWGRADMEPQPTARQPAGAASAAAGALGQSTLGEISADSMAAAPAAPATVEVGAEPDARAAVEVAAVDFGTHMGSVFYVSAGRDDETQAVTAVIWVTDDGAGERR